jgi:hypothetical protein
VPLQRRVASLPDARSGASTAGMAIKETRRWHIAAGGFLFFAAAPCRVTLPVGRNAIPLQW